MPEQALTLGLPSEEVVRPIMRGTLHLGAAVLAPFGLVLLLLLADKPSAYVGASLYATTLILLYSSSASYHLLPWRASWRRVMKRVDHAMIFALIAGTYTPFCLIVLGLGWGITMLALVWTLAGLGMLLKIIWPDAPRWLGVGLYLALGWIGLIPAYELTQRLNPWALGVLLLGGLFYTVGGIVYARRRPDPYPRVFGFHEVFHALVIAGTLVHFGLIAAYLM